MLRRTLLTTVALAAWTLPGSSAAQDGLPLDTPRRLQFTATEGTWMSVDISPDGRTIVFDLLGDLYTLPARGGRAERITSGPGFDQQPRFSPDGSRLAFVSDRSGADNVWLINADGSDPRPLTNETRRVFVSPEWTPDGQYIVTTKTTDVINRPQQFHLFLYHVSGGTGVQLTGGDTVPGGEYDFRGQAHLGAAFGADGERVYMSAASSRGYGNWQIAVLDRATGRIDQRSREPQSGMRPVLSPDGRYLVYATRYDGTTGLKVVELDGGDERWLVRAVDRDAQESLPTRDLLPGAAFTPDSRELVVAFGGAIRRVDVATGVVTDVPFEAEVDVPMGALAQFTYPLEDGPVVARRAEHVTLSPDGQRLAYMALDKIWIQDLPDGQPRRLADTGTDQFFPAWSPDGRWIAFSSWDDMEGGDIYRAPADGRGRPEVLTTRKAFYERIGYAPDGTRLVAARGPRAQRITFFDELIRGRPQSTELVWLPAAGGDATTITPLRVATRWTYPHHGRPHFTDDTSRVVFFDPVEGLLSVRWDGSERRRLLDVRSWEWTYNPQVPVDDVQLAPTGDRALALANGHVYLLEVPAVVDRVPTVSLTDTSSTPLPVRRLTRVGADYLGWSADGHSAYWAIGRTVTIRNLDTEADRRIELTVTIPRDIPRGVLALRGARLVTMRGDEVIERGDLIVTDNRITALGPSGTVDIPADAETIDATGKTILPGYVDIHAHMWAPWGVHRRQVWEYLANLAYGVTATRDPQTMTADVVTYADRLAAGEILGPRVLSTARGIFASEDFTSLEDARDVLRRYSEHYRTETIKNYLIGDRVHRQWLVQAALEQRLTPTAEGNSDFKMNLTLALDGYAGQEHSWPVFPLYGDVIQLMAQSGLVYTPTLIINYGGPNAENYFYREHAVHEDPKLRRFIPHAELDRRTLRRDVFPHESQWIFEAEAAQVAAVLRAGGRAGLGAHGQLQGQGVHWELWLLASGGMSNHAALRVATHMGAEAIGHGDDFGSLAAGMLADLQILGANPLDDIRHSLSVERVMANGRLYDADTMNEMWPRPRVLPVQWWQREGMDVPEIDREGAGNHR